MDKKPPLLPPLLALFLLLMGGCKSENHPFGNLNCQLTTTGSKQCPDVPTLEKGKLTISAKGHFELNGRYDACFHIEDVSIKGRTKLYKLHNGYALELLGTQFQKTDGSRDDFPRTIGFVHLNEKSMTGRFIDLWAVIRGQGQNRPEMINSHLQCKADGQSLQGQAQMPIGGN